MKSISLLTILSLLVCGCGCNCDSNGGADEQFGPNPGGEAKNQQLTPSTSSDKPGL